eukprot:2099407-Alexandrium_andersonii.AAC.1
MSDSPGERPRQRPGTYPTSPEQPTPTQAQHSWLQWRVRRQGGTPEPATTSHGQSAPVVRALLRPQPQPKVQPTAA